MVAKDHACQFPYCILTQRTKTCPDCGNWLCPRHLATHSCKKVDTWQIASTSLNAIRPNFNFDPVKFVVDRPSKKKEVKLVEKLADKIMSEAGVPESPAKPSRKDWKDIIDR